MLKQMYVLLVCFRCMSKTLLFLQVLMMCYMFTSAVDTHNAVRHTHTHTVLNVYRILFRFVSNTKH